MEDDDGNREQERKSSLPPNLQQSLLSGPISPAPPAPLPEWPRAGAHASGPRPPSYHLPLPPVNLISGSYDSGLALSAPSSSTREEQHFQQRGYRRTTTATEGGDPTPSSSRPTLTSSLSHGDVRPRGDPRRPNPRHAYPPPYREETPRPLFEGRTLPPPRPTAYGAASSSGSSRSGGTTPSFTYGPSPPPQLAGLERPYEQGRTPAPRTESAAGRERRSGPTPVEPLEAIPRLVVHSASSSGTTSGAGPSHIRAESTTGGGYGRHTDPSLGTSSREQLLLQSPYFHAHPWQQPPPPYEPPAPPLQLPSWRSGPAGPYRLSVRPTQLQPAFPPLPLEAAGPSASGSSRSRNEGGDGGGRRVLLHRKTQIACYFCRNRKLRCDGEKPCGNCTSRQLSDTCDYDTEVRRRGPAKKTKRKKTKTTMGTASEDEGGVEGRKARTKEEEDLEEEKEGEGEAPASGASRAPSNDPIASQIRYDVENREILPLTGSSVGMGGAWRWETEGEMDRDDGS